MKKKEFKEILFDLYERILKFLAVMLFISMIFTIGMGGTFASAETFEIIDVEIFDKSETLTINNIKYENNNIITDAEFSKVGESITFKITFKNVDSEDHIIKLISDNNKSDSIVYEYEIEPNEAIKADETKTIYVKATYVKEESEESLENSLKTPVIFTMEYDDQI